MTRIFRHFLILAFVFGLFSTSGCAMFGKKESKPDAASEQEVFEKERSEQEKMSDYAASAGRTNPREKIVADKGQTFLLSDKAKDIYNNLER